MPRRIKDLKRTRIDVYVDDTDGTPQIADVDNPTVAELNGGKNLSQYLLSTTVLGTTASDTTKERDITAAGNAESPTIGNYQGNFVLFRDGGEDAQGKFAFSEDDLLELFPEAGVSFTAVKRTGPVWTKDYAAGDKVEVYRFQSDNPMQSGGTQDGMLKLTVPGLPQGDFSPNSTVLAAAPAGGGSSGS